jgi:diguanylate cyclase (GGDEF)-like protein
MAEDIRQSIEKIRVPGSKDGVAVTASLGATLTAPAETSLSPKELVSKADQLLYKAKTEGRNRVVTSE